MAGSGMQASEVVCNTESALFCIFAFSPGACDKQTNSSANEDFTAVPWLVILWFRDWRSSKLVAFLVVFWSVSCMASAGREKPCSSHQIPQGPGYARITTKVTERQSSRFQFLSCIRQLQDAIAGFNELSAELRETTTTSQLNGTLTFIHIAPPADHITKLFL
jgi:hypothetical protein